MCERHRFLSSLTKTGSFSVGGERAAVSCVVAARTEHELTVTHCEHTCCLRLSLLCLSQSAGISEPTLDSLNNNFISPLWPGQG